MNEKANRLETLKTIISNMELSSQDEVLAELRKANYNITQATLSRDMKKLKVAKGASIGGKYVYVLPNNQMYRRIHTQHQVNAALQNSGFQSINFSGNMAVVRTRPGHASSIAYNIDNANIPIILGTIAGDDTIFMVIVEGAAEEDVVKSLTDIIPTMI